MKKIFFILSSFMIHFSTSSPKKVTFTGEKITLQEVLHLIQAGIDPNATLPKNKDKLEPTLLQDAVKNLKNIKIIKALLENNANPFGKSSQIYNSYYYTYSPIRLADETTILPILAFIANKYSNKLDKAIEQAVSTIPLAPQCYIFPRFKKFIVVKQQYPKKVQLVIEKNNYAYFRYAVIQNEYKIVENLLKSYQIVNIKDKRGNTALHNLVQQNHNKTEQCNLIKMLLKYGANVYLKNKKAKTALDLASTPIQNLINNWLQYQTFKKNILSNSRFQNIKLKFCNE